MPWQHACKKCPCDAEDGFVYTGQLEQASRKLSEAADALEAQKSAFQQVSNSQSSLERRLQIIVNERDGLKQIVTLYQEKAGPHAATAGAI